MRVSVSALLLLSTAVALTSRAHADGILYTLPKDGRWVLYAMTGSERDGRDNEVEKYAGTLTVSSVGTEKVNGEACRWIEIRHTWQNVTRGDKDDRVRILKVLVPEKHIGAGKTPSKHVIRGWRSAFRGSAGQGRVFSVRASDGSLRLSQPGGMIFGGPLKDREMLKRKTIATKLGKFPCTGVRGTLNVRLGNKTAPYTLTVWRNDKVPYGVVRLKMVGKEPDGDVVTMSATLQENGNNAKSELPKRK